MVLVLSGLRVPGGQALDVGLGLLGELLVDGPQLLAELLGLLVVLGDRGVPGLQRQVDVVVEVADHAAVDVVDVLVGEAVVGGVAVDEDLLDLLHRLLHGGVHLHHGSAAGGEERHVDGVVSSAVVRWSPDGAHTLGFKKYVFIHTFQTKKSHSSLLDYTLLSW